MNITQAIVRTFGGLSHLEAETRVREAEQLVAASTVAIVQDHYQRLLEEQFSYYDAQLQNLKAALQDWEDLGSIPGRGTSGRSLQEIAKDARLLFEYAPEAYNAVKYYTSIAVGSSLSVKVKTEGFKSKDAKDPGQELFDEVFEAEENEAVFSVEAQQALSDDLLVESRLVYLLFVDESKQQGPAVQVRTLENPWEVVKVITNPEDHTEIWYYKRTWMLHGQPRTMYYQFWRLRERPVVVEDAQGRFVRYGSPEDYLRSIDPQAKIARVGVLPDSRPVYAVMLEFGPIFRAAIDWIRQQARFMENRATIVRNRATFLDEYKVEGGSRAVAAVQQKFQSTVGSLTSGLRMETNPMPPVGSPLVHNKAIDTKQRSVDTGADDAEKDGRLFRSMPAAAFGIPAALLYMDAEASGNLNAIIELMRRAQGLWEGYRTVWHGFYRRLVRFVLETSGYTSPFTIDIDAPPLVEIALAEFTKAVIDGEDAGLVPFEEAARLYLVRIGSNNVDELVAQLVKEKQAKDKERKKLEAQGFKPQQEMPPQPQPVDQNSAPPAQMSAKEHAAIISQVLQDLREHDS